jgi:hypothetical protein
MLRALRRTRVLPLVMAALLLATMPASVTFLLHGQGDDDECNDSLVLHDHNDSWHRQGDHDGTGVAALLHLPLAAAALRHAQPVGLALRVEDSRRLVSSPVSLISAVTADGRAARAPPLS